MGRGFLAIFEMMKTDMDILVNHKLAHALLGSHAVFNYLTAIQNQITFDQKRDALNSLSAFAKFQRKLISLPDSEQWSVKEEVLLINEYFAIEKLRFGTQIDFALINQVTSRQMPSLVCVPFVELLLAAAMKSDSKPVFFEITFVEEGSVLRCYISVNKVLKPIDKQERNTEQKKRFELIKEKLLMTNTALNEIINRKQTQYTLIFTH